MTDPGVPPSPTGDVHHRASERLSHAKRVMVVHGESAWFAELQDFSDGGCGLFPPPDCMLEEDDVVRLFFYSDASPVVILTARVARVTEARIGIEYHESQPAPPLSLDQ